MTKRKVFGIGLPKTGTTSLGSALKRLGYKVADYPRIDNVLELAERNDAIADGIIIPYLVSLDCIYPDAQFVLTVRDLDTWIVSCRKHYTERIPPSTLTLIQRLSRKAIWGVEEYDEEIFKKVHFGHNLKIRRYFALRPERLLELNICAGEGYEKLCPFLGLPVMDKPFPHSNKGIDMEVVEL